MVAFSEGDGFFDREEKSSFGSDSEVLVLDFDKSGGGNLPTFGSVNTDSDFAAARQGALLFPIAFPCGSFVILRHDRIAAIGGGQAIDDESVVQITFKLVPVIKRDEVFVFCAVKAQR